MSQNSNLVEEKKLIGREDSTKNNQFGQILFINKLVDTQYQLHADPKNLILLNLMHAHF